MAGVTNGLELLLHLVGNKMREDEDEDVDSGAKTTFTQTAMVLLEQLTKDKNLTFHQRIKLMETVLENLRSASEAKEIALASTDENRSLQVMVVRGICEGMERISKIVTIDEIEPLITQYLIIESGYKIPKLAGEIFIVMLVDKILSLLESGYKNIPDPDPIEFSDFQPTPKSIFRDLATISARSNVVKNLKQASNINSTFFKDCPAGRIEFAKQAMNVLHQSTERLGHTTQDRNLPNNILAEKAMLMLKGAEKILGVNSFRELAQAIMSFYDPVMACSKVIVFNKSMKIMKICIIHKVRMFCYKLLSKQQLKFTTDHPERTAEDVGGDSMDMDDNPPQKEQPKQKAAFGRRTSDDFLSGKELRETKKAMKEAKGIDNEKRGRRVLMSSKYGKMGDRSKQSPESDEEEEGQPIRITKNASIAPLSATRLKSILTDPSVPTTTYIGAFLPPSSGEDDKTQGPEVTSQSEQRGEKRSLRESQGGPPAKKAKVSTTTKTDDVSEESSKPDPIAEDTTATTNWTWLHPKADAKKCSDEDQDTPTNSQAQTQIEDEKIY